MTRNPREADSRSAPEPVLVPERATGNSFLRFLEERRELFDQFGIQKEAVEEEESGWSTSPSFDTLIVVPMNLLVAYYSSRGQTVSTSDRKKAFNEGERLMRTRIFKKEQTK